MPLDETNRDPFDLPAALRHLEAGDAASARRIAFDALGPLRAAGNLAGQARCLDFLAHVSRLLSRYREAHDDAAQAAQLYRMVGDGPGEAGALGTQCHAASVLGRNEEAVEAGLLAVALCERVGDPARLAMARLNLGIALCQARSYDRAHEVLELAAQAGAEAQPPMSPFQARIAQACTEANRAVTERFETGRLPPADRMAAIVAECDRLVAAGDDRPMTAGVAPTLQALRHLVGATLQYWTGAPVGALRALRTARRCRRRTDAADWLASFEDRVRCEIALQRGRDAVALRHAHRALAVAEQLGHVQSALLSHLQIAHVQQCAGRPDLALDQLRRASAVERAVRNEGIDTRSTVVRWQLDMRRSEQACAQLEASAGELRRLSYEDALTGLANRRAFDLRIAEQLRRCEQRLRPIAVALIDIDHFKSVNDRHSHRVGDQVLIAIAGLLAQHVREGDLAARLAGDEFVLVFPELSATQAGRICERLRERVSGFDWGRLAEGLAVTVSVGLAEARPGEGAAAVVDRADRAMYLAKGHRTRRAS